MLYVFMEEFHLCVLCNIKKVQLPLCNEEAAYVQGAFIDKGILRTKTVKHMVRMSSISKYRVYLDKCEAYRYISQGPGLPDAPPLTRPLPPFHVPHAPFSRRPPSAPER